MSSDSFLRLSADESLCSGGYRLISVRELVKHNGLTDTHYTFRIDPPDQFITCRIDEKEHVFLSEQDSCWGNHLQGGRFAISALVFCLRQVGGRSRRRVSAVIGVRVAGHGGREAGPVRLW